MPKYRIYAEWESLGFYNVEANSMKEAIQKVEDCEEPYTQTPKNGREVDDTFSVREDLCEEIG